MVGSTQDSLKPRNERDVVRCCFQVVLSGRQKGCIVVARTFCKLWLNPGAKNDSAYDRRNNWPLLDSISHPGWVRVTEMRPESFDNLWFQCSFVFGDVNPYNVAYDGITRKWCKSTAQNGWISTSLLNGNGKKHGASLREQYHHFPRVLEGLCQGWAACPEG